MKRTLTVKKNSLYMRFFLWAWRVNPSKLNTCKLFWGTVFFPLGFFGPGRPWSKELLFAFYLLATACALISSVLNATEGHWVMAFVVFLCALMNGAGAFTGWRNVRRKKSAEETLSAATKAGTAISEWLMNRIGGAVDLAFDISDAVRDSEAGDKVGGWLSVVGRYFRSLEERTCLDVRIV